MEIHDVSTIVLLLIGVSGLVLLIGYIISGPTHHPLFRTLGLFRPKPVVKGFVAPGYEKVLELFKSLIEDGQEDHAQACAYVDGKIVVDLVGIADVDGSESNEQYASDSIQNVFSSSKVITSIVVAMLVDRKLLSYDTTIASIWPEFGQHGKDSITVSDLMRHESGLQKFKFCFEVDKLQRPSLKSNSDVAQLIAGAQPKTAKTSKKGAAEESGRQRAYHALTRGWVVNEIVRRVDPAGRTVGEFVRDEIAVPLGLQQELTLGCETGTVAHRIQPLKETSSLWLLLHFFKLWGRTVSLKNLIVHLILKNVAFIYRVVRLVAGQKFGKPSFALDESHAFDYVVDLFNHPSTRTSEIPSANVHASARALAKVAAVMAGKGQAHGLRLLSEETVALADGGATQKFDHVLKVKTTFTTGGWAIFSDSFGYNRQGSSGWIGMGGSAMQWHAEQNVGFGYTCNLFGPNLYNRNSAEMQNAVIDCAKSLQAARGADSKSKLL